MKPWYFLATVLLAGCGYVGAPLPPTLDMPMRITDLTVAERGDQIVAQFTVLPLTTEGLPLKSVRSVEIRAGVPGNPFNLEVWAVSAKRYPVTATGPGLLTAHFPVQDWVGQNIIITARATGPKGKSSEWATPKQLSVDKPLVTPTNLKLANLPQGIGITWQGAGPRYRIYRSVGDEDPAQLGETADSSYLDAPIEYGTRYRYWVVAAAGELLQSDTAGPAELTPADIFPPAVPAGLTADPGVSAIELSWERNTEPDFKGYNVFRAVEAGPFEKIATLIVAPTYSDRQVEAGRKYRYQLSAADVVGNESGRSAAIEVVAQ